MTIAAGAEKHQIEVDVYTDFKPQRRNISQAMKLTMSLFYEDRSEFEVLVAKNHLDMRTIIQYGYSVEVWGKRPVNDLSWPFDQVVFLRQLKVCEKETLHDTIDRFEKGVEIADMQKNYTYFTHFALEDYANKGVIISGIWD